MEILFFFLLCRNNDETESSSDEIEQPAKRQCTLMDVVRSKMHWPCSKNDEQSLALREYTTKYKNDKNYTVNYLESFIRNTCTNSKLLLHDSLIILFKSCISGVCREHVEDFNKLISSVTQLI